MEALAVIAAGSDLAIVGVLVHLVTTVNYLKRDILNLREQK